MEKGKIPSLPKISIGKTDLSKPVFIEESNAEKAQKEYMKEFFKDVCKIFSERGRHVVIDGVKYYIWREDDKLYYIEYKKDIKEVIDND